MKSNEKIFLKCFDTLFVHENRIKTIPIISTLETMTSSNMTEKIKIIEEKFVEDLKNK